MMKRLTQILHGKNVACKNNHCCIRGPGKCARDGDAVQPDASHGRSARETFLIIREKTSGGVGGGWCHAPFHTETSALPTHSDPQSRDVRRL